MGLVKQIFKYRKVLTMAALAVMAVKSKTQHQQSEDNDIIQAKKLLEQQGYKISKSSNSIKYAQKLYQDNPQLVDQAVNLIRKFGKF